MPRLLLVRHGQTDWNKEHRFQGSTDIPLNAWGRQQIRALGEAMASETIDAIWASDLQRAADTAQAIAEPHDLTVQLDPRLREFYGGDWEGMTMNEIRARYAERFDAWLKHASTTSPPNGEPIQETVARLEAVLQDVRRLPDDYCLVLAAHGGVNNMLICLAMGFSLDVRFQFMIEETSITELQMRPERTTMTRLNDRYHLQAISS